MFWQGCVFNCFSFEIIAILIDSLKCKDLCKSKLTQKELYSDFEFYIWKTCTFVTSREIGLMYKSKMSTGKIFLSAVFYLVDQGSSLLNLFSFYSVYFIHPCELVLLNYSGVL